MEGRIVNYVKENYQSYGPKFNFPTVTEKATVVIQEVVDSVREVVTEFASSLTVGLTEETGGTATVVSTVIEEAIGSNATSVEIFETENDTVTLDNDTSIFTSSQKPIFDWLPGDGHNLTMVYERPPEEGPNHTGYVLLAVILAMLVVLVVSALVVYRKYRRGEFYVLQEPSKCVVRDAREPVRDDFMETIVDDGSGYKF